MKILILGAGAVGGYFGGRLVQEEGGADVTFLIRKGRAEQLIENGGLTIEDCSNGRTTTIPRIKYIITPSSEETGRGEGYGNSDVVFDVIVLACKAYSLSGALDAIAPFVHDKVSILPLLNGMAHLKAIKAKFPNAVVWGGTCGISATLTPNGKIQKMTESQYVIAGKWPQDSSSSEGQDDGEMEDDNNNMLVLRELIKLMQEAGIEATVSDDMNSKMWGKWTSLATLAAATTLFGGSVGDILGTDSGRSYIDGVYRECNQVATACRGGKELDRTQQKKVYERVFGNPNSIVRASMARDMQNGNPTEADHVLGDMIQRATQKGISMPLLSIAYTRLQIYEQQRQH